MISGTNAEEYYKQMRKSLGDKSQILNHLTGKTVLEIGYGDGSLLSEIEKLGFEIYGIDASKESYDRAKENGLKNILLGDISNIEGNFDMKFDNIILCSVAHEIYSYKRNDCFNDILNKIKEPAIIKDSKWYSEVETEGFLKDQISSLEKFLNPGGKLIIRDCVDVPYMESDNICSIKIDDDSLNFLKEWSSFIFNPNLTLFIDNEGEAFIKDTKSNIFNFMYTYTWGWSSLNREGNETPRFQNLEWWKRFISSIENMKITYCKSYFQEGYRTENIKKLNFYDEKLKNNKLADTNMIIVAEKESIR